MHLGWICTGLLLVCGGPRKLYAERTDYRRLLTIDYRLLTRQVQYSSVQ